MLESLNRSLFLFINATPDTAPWLIMAARVGAKELILLLPLLLVALWLRGEPKLRALSLHVILAVGLGLAVNGAIGALWPHPRPFVIGLGHVFIHHAPTPSFPSNHATILAAAGFTLLFAHARRMLGVPMLVLCLIVSWSRVFVGVHFPLDMLGGWIVGLLASLIVLPVWQIVGNTLTFWIEALYRKLFAFPIARGWLRR